MLAAARSGANMIPPMIAAASAEASLGEICDALRSEWGGYFEAPAF
jgi:methylmalonyl-CoA mutase N-terminal domain/subunit